MNGSCRENMLLFKSLESLTAAALLGQSKWRESRESAYWGGGGGGSIWCQGSQCPLIRVCGMSLFKAVPMRPSAALSDFGSRRYRWFRQKCFFGGLRGLWSGDRVFGVSMDAFFQGCSNDTIASHVRLRRQEISFAYSVHVGDFLPHTQYT